MDDGECSVKPRTALHRWNSRSSKSDSKRPSYRERNANRGLSSDVGRARGANTRTRASRCRRACSPLAAECTRRAPIVSKGRERVAIRSLELRSFLRSDSDFGHSRSSLAQTLVSTALKHQRNFKSRPVVSTDGSDSRFVLDSRRYVSSVRFGNDQSFQRTRARVLYGVP